MNKLTGTLPSELGNMRNLLELFSFFCLSFFFFHILTLFCIFNSDLQDNILHGEIPESYGSLASVSILFVSFLLFVKNFFCTMIDFFSNENHFFIIKY